MKNKDYCQEYYYRYRKKENDRAKRFYWKNREEVLVKKKIRDAKQKVELSKLKQNKNMSGSKEKITKEMLQFIVDNYGEMPVVEISEKLGVPERKIKSWASIMRRSGVDIPKYQGGQYGSVIRAFVTEYLEKHPEKTKDVTIKKYPRYKQ